MKKLLGSTLALALLVPAAANADVLKNLQVGGEINVDAVSANNVQDFQTKAYDQIGTVQNRVMVHANWDLLDDVHAHVAAHDEYNFGTDTEKGSAASVDEAYVKIDKLFGALDTTIGRQFFGEQGDLVIYFGPKYNLYGQAVTALDGARFDWNGEKVGVTALGSELKGNNNAAPAVVGYTNNSGDISLYGLDLHAKPTDNISGSAYVYDRTTVNSGTGGLGVVGNDYLYIAGLRAKVTMGGAWLKAEYDKDFGSNRTVGTGVTYVTKANYTGQAAKLDAGDKLDLGVGALTGWGSYGIGSGGKTSNRDFQAIAGDYRPGGIYGRFLASGNTAVNLGANATLSDLQIIGVGAKFNPSALSKLTAGVSWYNYRFQSMAGATAVAQNINGNVNATAGSNQIGNEADLDLTWQHSENVSVSAGLGDFQPNGFLKTQHSGTGPQAGVNPATMLYADASIKF